MKHFSVLLLVFFFIVGCNDGDIIVKNFNFDEVPLKTCGEIGSYVFYKENPESFESLSLLLSISDSLYTEPGVKNYSLSSSNTVNYRRYDGTLGNNYFCTSIPPSSPNILEEYKAVSGVAELLVTFEYENGQTPPKAGSPDNQNKPAQETLHKHLQIVLKDLVLIKGDEQIIIQTLDMGTIEDIEVIEL